MVRTQIQLTEKQAKLLKKLSNKLHISLSELIRRGVDEILKSLKEISPDERKKRAIEAAGRFHSGRKDLSEKHDEHLSEVFKS